MCGDPLCAAACCVCCALPLVHRRTSVRVSHTIVKVPPTSACAQQPTVMKPWSGCCHTWLNRMLNNRSPSLSRDTAAICAAATRVDWHAVADPRLDVLRCSNLLHLSMQVGCPHESTRAGMCCWEYTFHACACAAVVTLRMGMSGTEETSDCLSCNMDLCMPVVL